MVLFCNARGFALSPVSRFRRERKHTKWVNVYHLAKRTVSLLFPVSALLSKNHFTSVLYFILKSRVLVLLFTF